jgi:hypothetical protein
MATTWCGATHRSGSAHLYAVASKADECEITLKHDYADGLEGLFEFCYRGTYTCTTSTAPGLEKAMKQFLRDARVFVVGDKYMADGLVARALNGAKADVEYGLVARSPDNLETRRFLKWVVETVYLRQHILGSEQEASDTRVGDEEAGGETEYSEEDPDAYTADDFDMGHFLYIPT